MRSNLHNHHIHILIILFIVCMASCRHKTTYSPTIRPIISALDSMQWLYAYPYLDSVSLSSLNSRADSAAYYMVAYNNHKLHGLTLPPDSLIGFAADYYLNEGADDKYHAMIASYLRSCSYFDNQMYADAVYHALHLEPLAKELKDTLYLTRFCDIMANSYLYTDNKLEGARYMTEGAKLYVSNPHAGDGNFGYFLTKAVGLWESIHQIDSISSLTDSCIPLFLRMEKSIPYIVFIVDRNIKSSILIYPPNFKRVIATMDSIRKLRPEIIKELPESNLLLEKYCRYKIENKEDSIRVILSSLETSWRGFKEITLAIEKENQIMFKQFPDVVKAHQKYISETENRVSQDRITKRSSRIIGGGLLIILFIMFIGEWFYRRSQIRQEAAMEIRIDELRGLVTEMDVKLTQEQSNRNELKILTDQLFRERLNTLNILCDNYFINRSLGDKAKNLFYTEFEKQISELSSRQSIMEIEDLVNKYKDGIVRKLRTECPALKEKEIDILSFIYAGFSARAICIFMNISRENFYVLRKRIKDKIIKSGSTISQVFIDEMQVGK